MSTKPWLIRPARLSDRQLLKRFSCADPSVEWQVDVEEFIQETVFTWAVDPHARPNDPRLLLVLNRKPRELIGVVAHERAALLEGAREISATKLEVLAVARGWQGRAFETGDRVSDVILSAGLTDVRKRVPRRDARVYAVVHQDNHRGLRLCARHGLTLDLARDEEWPEYRRLVTERE